MSAPRRAAPWAVAAIFALVAGIALWAPWRRAQPAPEPIRTQVHLPENVDSGGRNFTLSPDSRKLAFSAVGSDGIPRVWVRFMDSLDVRQLPGTETTQTPPPFFWSHDSRFVAYSAAGGKLKRVDLDGSPPQTLSDTIGPNAPGGAWNRDGVIIFGSWPRPTDACLRVGRNSVRRHGPGRFPNGDPSRLPHVSADGRHFLYLRTSAVPENSGVYLGSDRRQARGARFQATARDGVRASLRAITGAGTWLVADLPRRECLGVFLRRGADGDCGRSCDRGAAGRRMGCLRVFLRVGSRLCVQVHRRQSTGALSMVGPR